MSFAALVFLISFVLQLSSSAFGDDHQIGGTPAVEGQFKFFVRIVPLGVYIDCGGALIHSEWVLTAVTCLKNASVVWLTFGVIEDYSPGALQIESHELYRHSEYDDESQFNNIALIKVRLSIDCNEQICPSYLPVNYREQYFDRQRYNATDFFITGFEENFEKTKQLRYLNVNITTWNSCSHMVSNIICAINDEKIFGEMSISGSPLTLNYQTTHFIIGVGSFVNMKTGYMTFTKVEAYLQWIGDIIGFDLSAGHDFKIQVGRAKYIKKTN